MSHSDFMRMTDDAAWKFLEKIAKKTMQWEGFNKKPPTTNSITTSRSGVHSIENSIAVEAKMAALMRRIEMLKSKGDSSAARSSKSDLCLKLL